MEAGVQSADKFAELLFESQSGSVYFLVAAAAASADVAETGDVLLITLVFVYHLQKNKFMII